MVGAVSVTFFAQSFITGSMPPEPAVPEPATPPVGAWPPAPPLLVVPPVPVAPPEPPAPHETMQAFPQSVVPARQVHEPFEQLAPMGQSVPHAPQFKMSFDVFTHKLPHVVWAHVALQTRFEQKPAVDGQTLPQLPQLLGSPCRFKHDRPQASYGAVQAHCPA
jgi:hypothetical protein